MSRHDPQGAAFSFRMKVNAATVEVIVPCQSNSLEPDFALLLAGDAGAASKVFHRLKNPLLRQVRHRAPDLPVDIAEDVLMDLYVLMAEHGSRFDPSRGTARGFVFATLLPEALRRVRAENVPPGAAKRLRSPNRPKHSAPPVPLDDVDALAATVLGYGSPDAVEAACDVSVIWSRIKPEMRIVIGGLADGNGQAEIADEAGIDRFKVARMIKDLQHQFAVAA